VGNASLARSCVYGLRWPFLTSRSHFETWPTKPTIHYQ